MESIKFVDVMTDEGFKRVFGVEANMILLLRAAFKDRKIVKVKYLDKEMFGRFKGTRRSIYDLYCEDDEGRKFIVEVQYKEVDNFINRSIYYVSNGLQQQTRPGRAWKNDMKPVYFLALMPFNLPGTPERQWLHRFELREETSGQRLTENLRFVYIELGKFDKQADELCSDEDRMAYFMKHAATLQDRPTSFGAREYDTLFNAARFAGMDLKRQRKYMNWLQIYRDNKNADERAKRIAREEGLAEGFAGGFAGGREQGREEGKEEGREETKAEIAKGLVQNGVPMEIITKVTGLTAEDLD